jgi:hypothetical protein
MQELSLSEELIKRVIDDPSLLSHPASINLSQEQATSILEHGYTKGFRSVFILNASLSAAATLTSIFMIKHKNLTRDDDEKFREVARGKKSNDEEKGKVDEDHDEKMATSEKESTETPGTTDHGHSEAAEMIVPASPGGSSAALSGTLCPYHPQKNAEGGAGVEEKRS